MNLKVTKLQVYSGVGFAETPEIKPGDICILRRHREDVKIGDTICNRDRPEALTRLTVDEPTVAMNFYRNNGPFAGTEGKYVQPGKIHDRLVRKSLRNVSIRVEQSNDKENYNPSRAAASSRWPSSSRPCAGKATNSAWAGPGSS